MEIFSATWQDAFYVVGSLYMGFMLLVTIVVIIAVLVIKRRVKKRLSELKKAPLRGKVFLTTFLQALFR